MRNMAQSGTKLITQVTLIEEELIIISVHVQWYQEDTKKLADEILTALHDAKENDTMSGADRATVRFNWQGGYFLLNFECYSQSCWISPEDMTSQHLLSLMFSLLNNKC